VFERTYRPRLGIVQIAVAGEIALIDAVRIPDLSALGPLLADPARRKLLHSDRATCRSCGARRRGAARPARHADRGGVRRPRPVAVLRALVKTLLGVELAKHETRTDWLRRPLSPDQLRYAAEDVDYLPGGRADLEERPARARPPRVGARGFRRRWPRSTATPDPEVAWRARQGDDRLPASARAVARSLARGASAKPIASTWRARSCCATKRCWRSPSETPRAGGRRGAARLRPAPARAPGPRW
jgi:ribonuclease D